MSVIKCPECGKEIMVNVTAKYPKEDERRFVCEKCDAKITEGVSNWSLNHYGRALCMDCQGKEKK